MHLVRAVPHLSVACTPRAKGVFPEDHERSLGVFGFAGHPAALSAVLEECDLLIVVGSRLGEISSAGWHPGLASKPMVQVDTEPSEIGRNFRARVGVVSDAGNFFRDLTRYWKESHSEGLPAVAPSAPAPADDEGRAVVSLCHEPPAATGLLPSEAMRTLDGLLSSETHVYVDIGNTMAWAIRGLSRNRPGRFHVNLSFGCMGHAIPAAIGGALHADGPVVALVGDAAFAMTGFELHTAVEEQLDLIVIVFNNSGHGMVRIGSECQFGVDQVPSTCFTHTVDAAAVAAALGARARVVRSTVALEDELDHAMRRHGPTLIDLRIDGSEIPPFGARMEVLRQNFGAGSPGRAE